MESKCISVLNNTPVVQSNDQGRTSRGWRDVLSRAQRTPRSLPSSRPAADPITTATVTPPLWLQHSSSFQPIGSLDASLIYIQVKDSTDGVKDPVAMETELGQDGGSLVMLWSKQPEEERERNREATLQIIKQYCFFNESINFNMCFHFPLPAVYNNLYSNISNAPRFYLFFTPEHTDHLGCIAYNQRWSCVPYSANCIGCKKLM